MLILEPDGQLDRLPRRHGWRARLLAWLFGVKRTPGSNVLLPGTLLWEEPAMEGEDATVSGII